MAQRFVRRQHDPLAIDLLHFLRRQPAFVDTDRFVQQPLCGFAHQARRTAVRGAHDRATRRIRSIVIDTRCFQCGIVEECGMPAGVAETDRVVRGNRIQ